MILLHRLYKMQKCKLTNDLVTRVIRYIKSGYNYANSTTKTRQWYDKWQPELRKGILYYKNKPLITNLYMLLSPLQKKKLSQIF